MPVISLTDARKEYEKMKEKLNSSELAHVIKLIFNDIDEPDRIQILHLLKNTGYLQPFVKPGVQTKCPNCRCDGYFDLDEANGVICPVCKRYFIFSK